MIKTLLKLILLNVGFLATISCQTESNLLIEPSSNESIKTNTAVASLLQRLVTHDGSKDNILDNANCFSIELPVTVVANGVALTINSEADYLLIETVFHDNDDDDDDDSDSLIIIFPIKIILNDFSKIVVNNANDLTELAKDCKEENDTKIVCIDVVYPISFSIYNSSSQLSKTLAVQSDEQFYELLNDIEDFYIVQVNFPVSLILYDGTVQVIATMEELKTAIEAVDGICNEDDD